MPIKQEYLDILETAKNRRNENSLFLKKLKSKRPADLDKVTHAFHDKAFESISCLECANCCSTTGPLFKNRDIDQLAAVLRMKPAAFLEKYLRIDEDGDRVLKSVPCAFLQNDNHCSVYNDRPAACRQYPHTQQRDIAQKLPITFRNTMICPAVALVVQGLKDYYSKNNQKKVDRA